MFRKLKNKIDIVTVTIAVAALVFSFWLMFSTFGYKDGSILIAPKARSDFGSHIPLIRSFSLGNNFPPEYPIFPGEPIRYHFLFYLLVGLIERAGLRIDFALVVPSALSFSFLIVIIYLLAKLVFKSRFVGILSVISFLFNGSLSFLEFFKAHPVSLNTPFEILKNTTFPSFGPYDGKIVSAFWNLNIFTNQMHLAPPLALLLFLVYLLIKNEEKKVSLKWHSALLWGVFLGILPFSHSSIFIMALAILGISFLLFKHQRVPLLLILALGVILSLPRTLYLKDTAIFVPQIKLGYLITDNFNIKTFLTYWFMNFGLFFVFMPLGFLLSPKNGKKLFIAFLPLFVIGNLIQFSPEMASNHKFFNVFLIIGNMLAAYLIYKIWKAHLFTKIFVVPLVLIMTLSGIIDFFAIKNDGLGELPDYPNNPDIAWIMENTPKDTVFLNSTYFFDAASLAGRKIFFGWPYFAWSVGHDTYKRDKIIRMMLNPSDLPTLCKLLRENNIDYISIINDRRSEDFEINFEFFKENFLKIYENPRDNLVIYETLFSCKNALLSPSFSGGN